MSSTQTRNAITLKGSVQLVTQYLNFGINSILFQRGIYPSDSFKQEEHFGLTIYLSEDEKIIQFIQSVLGQIQKWLLMKKIQKISMVITDITTKEPLERWDFKLQYDESCPMEDGGDDITGKKDIKIIQKEIKDVLRQICSTVSFLPLLDSPCAFDLLVYAMPDCEVPDEWNEAAPCFIANSQELQLKSFHTSFHKMDTVVSYKRE